MKSGDYFELPKKRPTQIKLKKAPGAPRRFKSAFIFFSTEKHREIRERMGDESSKAKVRASKIKDCASELPRKDFPCLVDVGTSPLDCSTVQYTTQQHAHTKRTLPI